MPASITQACLVVDVLGIDFRSHLIDRYVALELKEYRRIFRTNDEAGQLDNISRRFAWFRRLISNHELEQGHVFPSQWKVGWFLLGKFAEITRWVLFSVVGPAGLLNVGQRWYCDSSLEICAESDGQIVAGWPSASSRVWIIYGEKMGHSCKSIFCFVFSFNAHVENYSLPKSLDLRVPRISHKKPSLLPLSRILAFSSRLKTGGWYSCQVVYLFVTRMKGPGRNACTS